jgi:hypothetical protein
MKKLTFFLTLLTGFYFSSFGIVSIVQDNISVNKNIKSWIEIRDNQLIKQKYDYSCGSSALSTILKYYYNEDITEEEVLNFILKNVFKNKNYKKVKRNKLNLYLTFEDLKNYAEYKGYQAVGLALPIESLKKLKVPAIVYIKIKSFEHFSVFKGIDDKYVYLGDPSLGNIKIRIEKFKSIFYTRKDAKYPGKVLVILPKKNQKINQMFFKNNENFKIIFKVIKIKAFSP